MLGFDSPQEALILIPMGLVFYGGIAWWLYKVNPLLVKIPAYLAFWGFMYWLTVPIGENISGNLAALWAFLVTAAYFIISVRSQSNKPGGGMDGSNY